MALRLALQTDLGMATLEKFQLEIFFPGSGNPLLDSVGGLPKPDIKIVVFSSWVK